jgi:uncharacterized protein YcnI
MTAKSRVRTPAKLTATWPAPALTTLAAAGKGERPRRSTARRLPRWISRLAVLLAAVTVCVAGPEAALAHIQIRPTAAAPGDSVLFQLLVPGEREAHTVQVALQIPKGVLPFSFEHTPGWQRKVDLADDGSIDVVRWRGRLETDGFVRFAFLAATPEREGQIEWKALQTYDDGQQTRWIGPADSENPAAVTNVTASAARENAGGEAAAQADENANPAQQSTTATNDSETTAPTDQQPTGTTSSGEDGSTLAVVLGAAGLLLGAIALIVALTRRRPSPEVRESRDSPNADPPPDRPATTRHTPPRPRTPRRPPLCMSNWRTSSSYQPRS